MEKFPDADYSAETQASNEAFDARAKERNKPRDLKERLFGHGRQQVSGVDLMREEAYRVNKLVDTRAKEEEAYGIPATHPQDAADEIVGSKEFGPTNDVQFEESLRSEHALLFEFVDYLFVDAVVRNTKHITDTLGDSAAAAFEEGVHAMLQNRVDTLIRSNDITRMRALLESNDAVSLAQAGLAPYLLRMPQEILLNPVYQPKIQNTLFHVLDLGVGTIEERFEIKERLAQMREPRS